MKKLFPILLVFPALLAMAAVGPVYRGTFVGDATSVTNTSGVIATRTYSDRRTLCVTNLVVIGTNSASYVAMEYDPVDNSLLIYDNGGNKLAKFSGQGDITNFLPHVVALRFYGDAGGLTNITASSTNADTATIATYVSTAPLTNQVGAQKYLTVNATAGTDGIPVAIRRAEGQTNRLFEVQTAAAGFLFGVETNGTPIAPRYRVTTTNAMILTAPDGGTWLLNVNNDGSLVVRTNSTPL